ncbi:hypothetical protein SBRCBS47491_003117 [Sporothrix bragantina]|uniref:Uncharacterized protein n=1 Tax=Sporothrix bragantina TaxID=671064 RepID=A0ABP0BCJ0_9PEZI
MAKGKGAAGGAAVANRPAYSRVSYLFQAAALLAGTKTSNPETSSATLTTTTGEPNNGVETAPLQGMARRLLTQMRSVSRKTNMRVRPVVKHRVCKYCDTLLVEGTTSLSVVENHSRGGCKPWADVLVVTCTTCGRSRRYPVSAPRQPRRPARQGEAKDAGLGEGQVVESDAGTNQADKPKKGKQGNNQDKLQQTVVVGRGKGQKTSGGSAKNAPG